MVVETDEQLNHELPEGFRNEMNQERMFYIGMLSS